VQYKYSHHFLIGVLKWQTLHAIRHILLLQDLKFSLIEKIILTYNFLRSKFYTLLWILIRLNRIIEELVRLSHQAIQSLLAQSPWTFLWTKT